MLVGVQVDTANGVLRITSDGRGPSSRTIRVPLFAARTLNAADQYRVNLPLRQGDFKSSLFDTTGEKGGLKSARND